MKFNRVVLIVMDSVGIGALPDAHVYHDTSANTLGNLAKANHGVKLPNLEHLGLANLVEVEGLIAKTHSNAYQLRASEKSVGKDTLTGHWEMMGLQIDTPFMTFTDTGFPQALLDEISQATGRNIIGNKSASGTAILDELGEQHIQSGDLIVYTSADSVLQIAAHEKVVPIQELWNICKTVRDITMKPEWKVSRVIARPFLGSGDEGYVRTANRHDYALKPFGRTTLNELESSGHEVYGLGKINDIYVGEGITGFDTTKSNFDGMNKLLDRLKVQSSGLIFLNLVDFDAVYGHRRNPYGYAKCLEEFDAQLGELLKELNEDDLLIITADHGNDPTHVGTDHTREYVPVLLYSTSFSKGRKLEDAESFAVIGSTLAENFGVTQPKIGKSILLDLL